MNHLFLRLSVSLLTLVIGLSAAKISFDRKSPPVILNYETPLVTNNRFEKIGDLPAVGKYEYNPIQFVNEQDGWFAAEEKLWRTQDGGRTWQLVLDAGTQKPCDVCSSDLDYIKEFQFINSSLGWVLLQSTMFKTEDGGRSWQPFAEPLMVDDDNRLQTFEFLPDGKRGSIAGGAYRPLKGGESVQTVYTGAGGKSGMFGVTFQTVDGGETWHKQLLPRSGTIDDLFFVDKDHGWAIGTVGVYYLKHGSWKSTITDAWNQDYGEIVVGSLVVETGFPTSRPVSAFFVNPKLGWLNHTDGCIGVSKNGGKTWKDIVNFQDYQSSLKDWPTLSSINTYFRDERNGLSRDSHGAIRETHDGGASWTRIESDIRFSGMYFLNAQHGWATSEQGLFRVLF